MRKLFSFDEMPQLHHGYDQYRHPFAELSSKKSSLPEPSLPIIPTVENEEFYFQTAPMASTPSRDIAPSVIVPLEVDAPINDTPHNDEAHSQSACNDPLNLHANVVDDREHTPPVVPLRRSNRQRHTPSKLHDYYCDNVIQSRTSPHALSKVISYDSLTPTHKMMAMAECRSDEFPIELDSDESPSPLPMNDVDNFEQLFETQEQQREHANEWRAKIALDMC
nr:putative nuclease HARBI1 [Ipomoea batatas]